VSETNGHDPAVIDLDAIVASTRAPILRISFDMIRTDTLTAYELMTIGRTLGIAPGDLVAQINAKAGWTALELGQAFAWIIARRVDPALTWEQAQTYGLDVVTKPPDPTPAGGRKPRRRGTSGP
jgi:hypothetical protein